MKEGHLGTWVPSGKLRLVEWTVYYTLCVTRFKLQWYLSSEPELLLWHFGIGLNWCQVRRNMSTFDNSVVAVFKSEIEPGWKSANKGGARPPYLLMSLNHSCDAIFSQSASLVLIPIFSPIGFTLKVIATVTSVTFVRPSTGSKNEFMICILEFCVFFSCVTLLLIYWLKTILLKMECWCLALIMMI